MNEAIEDMLKSQGDRVVVTWPAHRYVLTITHYVITSEDRELWLVNRDNKTRKPSFRLTDELAAQLVGLEPNPENCQWELALKHAP